MLEDAMPGETFLSNMSLMQMAEKLEKSEAGRKKLRQAISMLKEKVEANEKVLEVNEILRQECEKERLRAEAEQNRAEEEKKLREQIEKDGLSTNEQLIRVLQRLDAVERDCKFDRNENQRMRKEMKEAISGLGGAVKAIEAAHTSFQGLEKSLLGKVNNSVSASAKCTSLTESAISDAKGAQGAALAAEKLSQSLVSQVAVLQKQGASLDQRVSLLQQELRMRQLEPLDNELKSIGNRAVNGVPVAEGKPSAGRGMFLSKNQQQGGRLSPKLAIADVAGLNVNVVQPRDTESVGTRGSLSENNRHGPNAAGITAAEPMSDCNAKCGALGSVPNSPADGKTIGVNRTRDGSKGNSVREALEAAREKRPALGGVSNSPASGKTIGVKSMPDASKGNSVREALEAAKEKRKLSHLTSSSKVVSLPENPSSCQRSTLEALASNRRSTSQDCLLECTNFTSLVQADCGNGSMPALLQNEKNNDSHRGVPVPRRTASKYGSNAEGCPAGRIVKNSHPGDKLPVALLKDITKLFRKEKKSHEKVEQKLAALQRVLQISEDDNAATQGLVDISAEKSRKRKRRESLKVNSEKKRRAWVDVTSKNTQLVAIPSEGVTEKVVLASAQVGTTKSKSNKLSVEDESTVRLQAPVSKSPNSGTSGRGNDISEAGLEVFQNSEDMDSPRVGDVGIEREPGTPANFVHDSSTIADTGTMASSEGMDMKVNNVTECGLNKGWDSDSESSEDEFGEEWWTTKRVLLSPNLPDVQPPPLLSKDSDPNAPLSWPAAHDVNLEDISLFLDVLPPIDQGACDKDRTAATFTNTLDAKLETEDVYTKSGMAAPSEEQTKDQSQTYAMEILSDLDTCSHSPTNNSFVQCLENKTRPLDWVGDTVEDEKKESLTGLIPICRSSMSCGSLPESSGFPPQDGKVISSTKSENVDGRLTADTGASKHNVLEDSQGEVKEEKLDSQRCAEMEQLEKLTSYLELVVGGSVHYIGADPTAGAVHQGPLNSPDEVSDKIMGLFRSTRKLLYGALNNKKDDAVGSSVAAAADIVSSFQSSTLSRLDLFCIFTASVVDSHALLGNKQTAPCLSSELKSLQLLVEISKQVFATEVFQSILPQEQAFLHFGEKLQKFLIRGSIQADGCQPIRKKVFAEGCSVDHFFHFALPCSKLARMRTLISGGKLLAVFCETIGKLDFLRNTVYLLLRFCDLDSEYLLSTISSFTSVACKNLFSVDNDDIVGRAVQVVISELIHDAEVERRAENSPTKTEDVIECDDKTQQGPYEGVEECSIVAESLQNLRVLEEVIGKNDDLTFEGFLPGLVNLFHESIATGLGSHLNDSQHLFQRSLQIITCLEDEPKRPAAATILDGSEEGFETCPTTNETCSVSNVSALRIEENTNDRSPAEDYCWRYVKAASSSQPINPSERDASLVTEWEQKFYDISNAVELVASHLGWEWTFNDFIVEHLWKLVSPGAPERTVACVAYMFGLLGRLGREVDGTELPGVDELRRSLLVVLNSDQTKPATSEGCGPGFSFRAQVAAAQSLLVLSSSNRTDESFPSKDRGVVLSNNSELHAKSVKCLWNWVKASTPEIQKILPSSLRSALLSINRSNFVPIF